jgi:hypothetical protein
MLAKKVKEPRWVHMEFFMDFWLEMTDLERGIYYYFFLSDIDRLIEPNPIRQQLADKISDKYCRNGKCKFDYMCCEECAISKKPCTKFERPQSCCIWFCDPILDELNKVQINLMCYRKITKDERTDPDPFHFSVAENKTYRWKLLDKLNKLAPCPPGAENIVTLVQLPWATPEEKKIKFFTRRFEK